MFYDYAHFFLFFFYLKILSDLFMYFSAPNPCAANSGKGPCSHLCLINYNQTFSCACPHLMKLQADKHTCYGKTPPKSTC